MNTKDLLRIKVKEVMTSELITVKSDTILKDVNMIFEKENIHHVPVISIENKFLGIISKSDILLLLDWGTKLSLPVSIRKNFFLLTSNLAKDVMVTNVIKVSPDDTIQRCVQIFRENYFKALPVVDDNDKLIGIITTYDLMILAYTDLPLLGEL
ncbi:MAG: CBS domain-containing protein [Saprospiraceae bacterium]|nr:CBS domain-containing protein [Saprospiraceae bacterium]